ncbi:hypothetical protein BWI96_10920 [Siphonobacter sp. SORGH_AS_0500]|nr:hypothetical protein [Siphonobacter sp. SORGH_AS_0500]PKK36373.1 hypothetical protein BWI96_10920 [Siphonobacter sp. SORGH_AS_0500]
MPVLTILVPSVVNFNAESWNTSIQIPKVAVFPNKVYRKKNNHKFMMTYDVNVKEEELALNIFPDYPIIVVKDNERIQVNNGKVRGVKQLNSFVIRDLNYSFIDESFNNLNGTKLSSGSRLATYDKFDSKVKLAYENNLQYPRDYIYYNIAPTIGNATGSFNSSYAEHLTTIQLVNSDIIKELVDDQITDYDGYPSFADGDLEFIVKVIGINNQNNAVEIVNKWFDVPFLGLVNLYHQNNQWYYGSSTKQYILPTPLELVPWNMQQYGDQIKVVLMEEDATTSYTQSITIGISSTFGFNYSNSIKDGPNFGSNTSNTNNVSSTYSLQVSGGHDMLYDAIIRWDDKILYWDEEAIPGYPNPPFNEHWARTKEFSTGKAIITIEPIPRR